MYFYMHVALVGQTGVGIMQYRIYLTEFYKGYVYRHNFALHEMLFHLSLDELITGVTYCFYIIFLIPNILNRAFSLNQNVR